MQNLIHQGEVIDSTEREKNDFLRHWSWNEKKEVEQRKEKYANWSAITHRRCLHAVLSYVKRGVATRISMGLVEHFFHAYTTSDSKTSNNASKKPDSSWFYFIYFFHFFLCKIWVMNSPQFAQKLRPKVTKKYEDFLRFQAVEIRRSFWFRNKTSE